TDRAGRGGVLEIGLLLQRGPHPDRVGCRGRGGQRRSARAPLASGACRLVAAGARRAPAARALRRGRDETARADFPAPERAGRARLLLLGVVLVQVLALAVRRLIRRQIGLPAPGLRLLAVERAAPVRRLAPVVEPERLEHG